MQWRDYHLHEFYVSNRTYGIPDPEAGLHGLHQCVADRKVTIDGVLYGKGTKAEYLYDFGAGWRPSILVEDTFPPGPGVTYPVCTAGKRRAPPEDSGGVEGYYRLLEILGQPDHLEHHDLWHWAGGRIDPEHFSLDAINDSLRRKFRATRARGKTSA